MKASLHFLFITMALLVGLTQIARATVTFTNTPIAVSNTYTGTITLQIGGLTNTETVLIQKYLDLNTNGIIDGGDLLVQQFKLTDGQPGMVIDGVTNFNVPGDLNATTGAITATLNFQNGDFAQIFAGKYLYKLSSPVGHFTSLTNSFTVTNFPYAQKFTGNVVSNSTSVTVSNAFVVLVPPISGNSGSPLAGVVANNAGSYTLMAPPGTYSLLTYRSNYVSQYDDAPVLMLAAGQTITTNLTLIRATSSISGKVVDAGNSSLGLPAVNFFARSDGGLFTLAFSDTNGNFTMPVTSDTWGINVSDNSVIVLGYLGPQNETNVGAGMTGLTFPCARATSLIYGSVKDNLGNPLVALDVYANDNNNLYQTDAYTDANGNYVLGVVGYGTSDSWYVQANGNNQLTNYVFSQQTIDGNINTGQSVLQNFTGILATNHITGNVKFNGTNIMGVGVYANATISNVEYNAYVDTDNNGNYSLNAANGTWSVGVNQQGGNDSLDDILGGGNYVPPGGQNVIIANNNGTANFIIVPPGSGQIFGYVTNTDGNPVVGVTVYVSDGIGDNYSNLTDGSGYYSFSVGNGNWDVSVDCGGLNSLGYQCVSDQMVNVSDDSVEQDFTAQASAPVLAAPVWLTNRFSMRFTGTAGQNYTVQMSTNLSADNWTTLYITNNPATNSFILTDPNATNNRRFYRILIGP
jgi:hypothetical protein